MERRIFVLAFVCLVTICLVVYLTSRDQFGDSSKSDGDRQDFLHPFDDDWVPCECHVYPLLVKVAENVTYDVEAYEGTSEYRLRVQEFNEALYILGESGKTCGCTNATHFVGACGYDSQCNASELGESIADGHRLGHNDNDFQFELGCSVACAIDGRPFRNGTVATRVVSSDDTAGSWSLSLPSSSSSNVHVETMTEVEKRSGREAWMRAGLEEHAR